MCGSLTDSPFSFSFLGGALGRQDCLLSTRDRKTVSKSEGDGDEDGGYAQDSQTSDDGIDASNMDCR